MTVEATSKVKERYGLLGIRTREIEETSIVEYRHAQLKIGSLTYSDPMRPFGLDYGPRSEYGHVQTYTPKTWAWVTGEDTVQVNEVVFDSGIPEHANERVLHGDEINAANLVTEDGKTRLTWRETQPGDYPETKIFDVKDIGVFEVPFTKPQEEAA